MNKYERLNQTRLVEDTKKRIAVYCRVSTDKDDQANSFESQQRYYREYVARHPDWELFGVFADEGISGTSTKKRKAFNHMIDCAKQGCFDLVITKEISRFARNTLDSIHYTRDLKQRGIGVIFLNDNINTLDADAELRLTIMSSIAQEESRKTSDRVKWGQKRRMEEGVVFGRDLLGYDVRGGRMYINHNGAKIVQMIFQKFVSENKGAHTIARELREEGHKTLSGNAVWTNTTLYKILRNEKYCGDLVQKKTFTPDYLSHDKKYNNGEEEFVVIKDHHEPIISRELFDMANKRLDERSLSPKGKLKYSNRYCFSGKIKCGMCGGTYVARYKTRKDGSVYKSWRCAEAVKNGKPHSDKSGNILGCASSGIRNDDALHIMGLVAGSLSMSMGMISGSMLHLIQSVVCPEKGNEDTEALRRRVRGIEEKKARLLELFISKDIDRDEFVAAREKCDAALYRWSEMGKNNSSKDATRRRQNVLFEDIGIVIDEIVGGTTHDEEFFRGLLDRIIVHDPQRIDVYLKQLPYRWRYTVV